MSVGVASAIFLLIVGYVVIAILGWSFRRYRRLGLLRRYGIPGPEPSSFVLGNADQLMSGPVPMPQISKWQKEYGDVFGYFVGETPYVVTNNLDLLKQVMIKDFHHFNNRPKFPLNIKPLIYTVLMLRDKRWKEVRSILTPTFSSGKMKLMSHILNKKVDVTMEMVTQKALAKKNFDIYELVQGLTLDSIAACALAMKTDCQRNPKDPFLIAVRDYFKFAQTKAGLLAIMFPFVISLMTFINNHLTAGKLTTTIVDNVQSAIDARRKNPTAKSLDLLQFMLEHQEDPNSKVRMTDEEVIANAYIILLGGYETTATALAFTFYLLIKHPDIQEKLYHEISQVEDTDNPSVPYLDQVLNESLRLYPPVVTFISRECDSDYRLDDRYTIPKGTVVMANIWDIHHNPELWPDPDKFDPERFSPENKENIHNLSFFPFGIGPRNCIGARFAQLEAKLAIFRLVKKFRFESCETTAEEPLQLICPTVIINPANGVHLKAVLRDS